MRRPSARACRARWLSSIVLSALLLPLPACAGGRATAQSQAQAQAQPSYEGRDDVAAFVQQVVQHQPQLDAAWVSQALAQARYVPAVAKLIMPPPAGTAKNWAAYRDRFVEPRRVRAGIEFWNANERWLDAAEMQYGVPPEIVVGIIGVETFYGRITGGFRVLDALATLSFDFPSGRKDRSAFFRDELEKLLVLANREGIDPGSIKGSYAGAMGLPQFMPSSWLNYAVDYDDDGHIDLQNDPADVIGSVAHFLSENGWQRDMPVRFEVNPPTDTAQRAELLVPDITPTFTATAFAEHGAALSEAGRAFDGPLALIELQNGDLAPSYFAGTRNFYALTRYNWSSYYAMAVIELGGMVARVRAATAQE